jgi:hypothetical protein
VRRLTLLLAALSLLSLLALLAPEASGRGLYVGHGLRSKDLSPQWALRLNVGGGGHAARHPLAYDRYGGWWKIAGYGTAGIEINVGWNNSLELYGTYRELSRNENLTVVSPTYPNGTPARVDYRTEGAGAGLTLRHYSIVGPGNMGYWGVGGGIIYAESRYQEVVGGSVSPLIESEDTGGEAHFVVGWDGKMSPALSLGIEIGFRYSWLDDTADFTGAFFGARLSLLLGRR